MQNELLNKEFVDNEFYTKILYSDNKETERERFRNK